MTSYFITVILKHKETQKHTRNNKYFPGKYFIDEGIETHIIDYHYLEAPNALEIIIIIKVYLNQSGSD